MDIFLGIFLAYLSHFRAQNMLFYRIATGMKIYSKFPLLGPVGGGGGGGGRGRRLGEGSLNLACYIG